MRAYLEISNLTLDELTACTTTMGLEAIKVTLQKNGRIEVLGLFWYTDQSMLSEYE